jgi:hypothetical protein
MSLFPSNPQIGDEFLGKRWDGTVWEIVGSNFVGPQGIQGIQGIQGEPGVVAATSPATYDAPTQTVGVDQTAITLAQSQVTGLATDLDAKLNLATAPYPVFLMIPTRYHTENGVNANNVNPPEGFEQAMPFIPARTCTIDRIGVSVVTAGSAGADIRIGRRDHDAANSLPGALISDDGTVDCTSTGLKEVSISWNVTAGQVYWITLTVQGGAATRPIIVGSNTPNIQAIGGISASLLSIGSFRSNGTVAGALASTQTWTSSSNVRPRPFVRST